MYLKKSYVRLSYAKSVKLLKSIKKSLGLIFIFQAFEPEISQNFNEY